MGLGSCFPPAGLICRAIFQPGRRIRSDSLDRSSAKQAFGGYLGHFSSLGQAQLCWAFFHFLEFFSRILVYGPKSGNRLSPVFSWAFFLYFRLVSAFL